jgi:putative ABC transport system permease protein
LTTASVALGVAALVAVAQATSATRSRFEQMRGALAEHTSLEVVEAEDLPFDQEAVADVANTPGVRQGIPLLERTTSVHAEQSHARAVLLGIDFDDLKQMRDIEMVAGRPPGPEGEVALELNFAQSLGVTAGDTVRLLTPQGIRPIEHEVSGVLAFQGAAAVVEVSSVFMPLATVQELWNQPGEITALRLALDSDANVDEVSRRIAEKLPAGLMVRPVRSRTDIQEETVFLVDQSLNITSTLSIGAAIFIVLNTYLMNVSERRRSLAIMRLVGATQGQLRRMLYGEALLVGLVGAVIGIFAGNVGGRWLARRVDLLFDVALPQPPMGWLPLIVGLVAGPVTALLAVAYPAYLAGHTPPLSGMQAGIATSRQKAPRVFIRLGLLGLALATVLYVAAIRSWISPQFSPAATSIGMVACVLLLPAVLGPVAYAASRLPALVWRTESELAQRQLTRNYVRSTLTAGVIFVVICAGVGVGNTILNAVEDIETWQARTFPADFLLRAKVPQLSASDGGASATETSDAIRRTPGFIGLERMTFVNLTVNDVPATLIVREYNQYQTLPIQLAAGNPETVRAEVLEGGVLLGTGLASRLGLSVGDQVTLLAGDEHREFGVVGVIGEYAAGGLVAAMDRQTAAQFLPRLDTQIFLVTVSPDELDRATEALDRIAKEEGLVLLSYAQFRQQIHDMIGGVVGGLWLLLVLGFVIAAFGVVNTLTMNVLEQTRELGLLRVVGMTRSQVKALVLAQAVILALLGLVPGVAAGVTSAWLSNRIFAALFGHVVAFQLQPLLVVGCFVVGLILATLAAFAPAQRASNLAPLSAIRIE